MFNVSGTKPAPKPCNLCGPGSPPLNTGESSGSIATKLISGYFSFKTLPAPLNVPPVPTPAKNASIVFLQIAQLIQDQLLTHGHEDLLGSRIVVVQSNQTLL